MRIAGLDTAVKDSGGGVIQHDTDWSRDPSLEFEWIRRLAERTGQTVSFTLMQLDETPGAFRKILDWTSDAVAEGVPLRPGAGCRPVGMLINLESSTHPFSEHLSYLEVRHLPLAERTARSHRVAGVQLRIGEMGRFQFPGGCPSLSEPVMV